MKSFTLLAAILLLVFKSIGQSLYFPPLTGDSWETTDPQSLGITQEKIDDLFNFLEEENSRSFILLKDGRIVLERYFGTFTQDSLWVWFSAGKSLRATMIGIAQQEGFLDISDKTSDYLGLGWSGLTSAQEDEITILNQLTMTSGLDERFFACVTPECLLFREAAGNRWAYHNGPYNLLLNVLESATGLTINQYTRSRIIEPIGMRSGFWFSSGTNTFFFSRARDMARFGLLIQNRGVWDGNPILDDPVFYDNMTSPSQDLNESYGYLWWLNGKLSHIRPNGPEVFQGPLAPDAPADVFSAAGGQGQFISISPGNGLVMVRQGRSNDEGQAALELHNAIWEQVMSLFTPVVTSINEDLETFGLSPNPASDFVTVLGGTSSGDGLEKTVLWDLSGRKVRETTTNKINLVGLKPGLYVVTMKDGQIQKSQKLIVQ